MSLIDVKCQAESCGTVREVYRSIRDWPKTPACETCGAETEQIHLPKAVTWTIDPVVVFKAPDGTYRFPGDANGASAGNYQKLGYERIEIRGATEMRGFERKMNASEYSQAQRKAEQKQAQREAREHVSRSILRGQMQSMSEFGKAVARAAMTRNDAKPRERGADPGFHSEVFSMDRSNRDASRDSSGRRRRD